MNYCFTAETRNYAMENISLELLYKCKYNERGCDANVKGKNKKAHEQMCNFR